jgi:membrane-associated phospholipid phosphatase
VAAANLHVDAPMTLARVHARYPWLLPVVAGVVLLLALGALFDALPWDRPITAAAVDARDASLDRVFLRISWFGSTPVVVTVSLLAAAVAWRRCPRLALAILVIALARPLAEWGLKELVARDRPAGDRLVAGTGHSFPSGHPMATAASWGVLPLVAALYTRRRVVWWSVAVGVWALAVAVAVSRVWLGVHWTSDIVAGLLLAVLGVAAAERFVAATHGSREPCRQVQRVQVDPVDQLDDSRLTTSTRT